MLSLEGLTALDTTQGLASDSNDSCPHVTTPSLTMGQTNPYASPLNIWRRFTLNIEPSRCGHVPVFGTHPCPDVDIWIKQGSNITNGGHYLRSDQYQHVDNICKRKTWKNHVVIFFLYLFGWSALPGRSLVHLSGFMSHTAIYPLHRQERIEYIKICFTEITKIRKKLRAAMPNKGFFAAASRVELSQLIPGRILCEHVALL